MKKLILAVILLPFVAAAADEEVKSNNCTSENYNGTMVTQCVDGTSTIVRSNGEIIVCKSSSGTPACTSLGGDK